MNVSSLGLAALDLSPLGFYLRKHGIRPVVPDSVCIHIIQSVHIHNVFVCNTTLDGCYHFEPVILPNPK